MREIQSHKSFSRYKFQAIPMYKHVHCVHVHVHVHVIILEYMYIYYVIPTTLTTVHSIYSNKHQPMCMYGNQVDPPPSPISRYMHNTT